MSCEIPMTLWYGLVYSVPNSGNSISDGSRKRCPNWLRCAVHMSCCDHSTLRYYSLSSFLQFEIHPNRRLQFHLLFHKTTETSGYFVISCEWQLGALRRRSSHVIFFFFLLSPSIRKPTSWLKSNTKLKRQMTNKSTEQSDIRQRQAGLHNLKVKNVVL